MVYGKEIKILLWGAKKIYINVKCILNLIVEIEITKMSSKGQIVIPSEIWGKIYRNA